MKSKVFLLSAVLFMLMVAVLMSFLLMNKINNFSNKGSSGGASVIKPPQDNEQNGEQDGENTESYIFEMFSCPTLRSAGDCSMSFKATMSLDLFDSILMDENKSIYTLVAPLDIFEQVVAYIMENSDLNPLVDDVDWYVWFLWSGQNCTLIPYEKGLTINGNVCEITASLQNIQFKNVNRPFLGVTYFEDKGTSGWDRTYAKLPEGENLKSYSRSLSYLVAEILNRNKYGLSLTDAELSNMQTIMSWSIDQLNGLEEASNTMSSYSVAFSEAVILKAGTTETISFNNVSIKTTPQKGQIGIFR